MSVVSKLELAMGPAERPRLFTLRGRPVGTGGAGDGVGPASSTDMMGLIYAAVRKEEWIQNSVRLFLVVLFGTKNG